MHAMASMVEAQCLLAGISGVRVSRSSLSFVSVYLIFLTAKWSWFTQPLTEMSNEYRNIILYFIFLYFKVVVLILFYILPYHDIYLIRIYSTDPLNI
jgi:hypothetical protein